MITISKNISQKMIKYKLLTENNNQYIHVNKELIYKNDCPSM
jgi:hypothetical protein